ncbi:hypothetical protein PVAND_014847 [Polypedilum vanderplanki]|uniref:MD-2-related lipid-recognition domain-containing protein n=1 Tax=Polypedilum vanderplanki TaxID=319348 RepID=A0A9J6BAX1_POLVA|nr:hypothetical protein PVAND_014847 [Polypedilum vanderplanki]
MSTKEILLFLLIFPPYIFAKRTYNALPGYGRFKFKLFKCEATEEGLKKICYPNYTSYAKAVNRTVSTINGYMLIRKPVYEAYMSGEILYKYGTIYRQVIKIPQFNFCEFASLSKSNILIRQLSIGFEAAAPGFVHECPYMVVEAYNITFPAHVLFTVFPRGDYKVILRFTLERDGPVMSTIITIGTADTYVKDTFG